MNQFRNRIWKRRRLWAALFIVPLSGVLWLAFTRLYISYQDHGELAKLWRGQHGVAAPRGDRPKVIAHRGAKVGNSKDDRAIGNTAGAIEQGTMSGSDWIEIDVLLSKDGALVVFHDAEIDHKTNGGGEGRREVSG